MDNVLFQVVRGLLFGNDDDVGTSTCSAVTHLLDILEIKLLGFNMTWT